MSRSDADDFSGRTAIVTGASRGLGKALALELGRIGCRTVCVARGREQLDQVVDEIKSLGGRSMGVCCDVSQVDEVQSMIDQVLDQFDQVDMLVNNAGIQGRMAWIKDYDPAEWDRVFAVNLRGAFLCCRAVLPGMIGKRAGKIVNVAAGVMDERVEYGVAAYCAAKAGLINFTRQLAAETKRHGLHVNAIDPAGLETEMSDQIMAVQKADPAFAETQTNLNRGPRLRPPEAIVPLVVFLLSQSSNMMTGRLLQASAPDDVQYLQL